MRGSRRRRREEGKDGHGVLSEDAIRAVTVVDARGQRIDLESQRPRKVQRPRDSRTGSATSVL
jgi:hypothetical protein